MELRLPGGGSFLDAFTTASESVDGSGHQVVASPSAADLDEALEGLQHGHVEFVILDDGGSFLQVAGEGDGPYQLEWWPAGSDGAWTPAAGPASLDLVRRAMHAYCAGDPAPADLVLVQEPPARPRRGLLGRLFGR
jgi:hypothetical protein